MYKVNSNDLKFIKGGVGPGGMLPDAANPLGAPSWGVLIDTNKGIICAYKGKNVAEGFLVVTLNANALEHLDIIRTAAGPSTLPPPTGETPDGCATYY